ncbi:uncharacterized protein ATC70_008902 [Mucor velutinosus]|uniref:Uncharacterized protein n=1 Tax=Mucor velutinosus TaxID=708070 RepID=A0AAN7DMG5_9FUNG|nr:hypothetical protein ATC70_008902 [Mucor velutinosus]
MLTRGPAACVILDLIPTPENRALAKRSLNSSFFDVVLTGAKHAVPFPIAKNLVQKNPHKYKTYPDTPPSSPQLTPTLSPSQSPPPMFESKSESKADSSPMSKLTLLVNERLGLTFVTLIDQHDKVIADTPAENIKANNKGVDRVMQERDTVDKNNQTASNNATTSQDTKPNSKPRNLITALRDNQSTIIRIAKALFMRRHKCGNTHRLVYATDQFIYDVLDKHIPISRIWTLDKLVKALKDDEDHFQGYDQMTSMRNIRLLCMVKERCQSRTVKKVLFHSMPNLCTYF